MKALPLSEKKPMRFYLICFMIIFMGSSLASRVSAQQGTSSALARYQPLLQQLEGLEVVEGEDAPLIRVRLKHILDLAILRAISLKAALVNIQAAQEAWFASREWDRPEFSASASHARTVNIGSGSSSYFTSASVSHTTTISAGLAKQLRNGMSWDVTYSETRGEAQSLVIENAGDTPEAGTFSDEVWQSSLTGSLNIPFYQDVGRELYEVSENLQQLNVDNEQFNYRNLEQALLNQLANIYWNFVGTDEAIKVQQEGVKLSEQLLQDNLIRQEAGVLSRADVRVTETQLATEKQNLLNLRIQKQLIIDSLRAALNMQDMIADFEAKDQPQIRTPDESYATLLNRAFDNDIQLRQLQIGLRSNDLTMIQAKNQDELDLDLNLSYTLNGPGDNLLGGVPEWSRDNLGGYSATLSVSVPLGDKGPQHTIRQRLFQKQQLTLQLMDRKSQIEVDLQSILRNLKLSKEAVVTARKTQSLAQNQYQDEIQRFELGKSTSFQVSQFKQDLLEASQGVIAARVAYEQAWLNLLVLTGDLYRDYGLKSRYPMKPQERG